MSNIVKQEFAIDGMSCGGCVASVTRAASRITGVQRVDVSLEGRGATIEFDPAVVDAPAIVSAIEAAGFEARLR